MSAQRGKSGMGHGDSAEDRLKGFASFETGLGGLVAIMTLLKRFDLLERRAMPESIEDDWTNRFAVLWDRLARTALGGPLEMVHASRTELWRMAKSIVAGIDNLGLGARCEWYPDGWAEVAKMIRADRRVPLADDQTPPEPPRPVSPYAALNALDYAATSLGIAESQVLAAAGLKKPLGEGAELAIMEWYEKRKRDG